MNNVILVGRLTADARITAGKEGKEIAFFTLAVDRFKKDAGADFVPCVLGNVGGRKAYLTRGQQVAVRGSLFVKGSKKDANGQPIKLADGGYAPPSIQVSIAELTLLGKRGDTQAAPQQQASAPAAPQYEGEIPDEEIPF